MIYQDLGDLIASCHDGNPAIDEFDCSVFDGHYVTGDIDGDYLGRLASDRNDLAKIRQESDLNQEPSVIELHNQS